MVTPKRRTPSAPRGNVMEQDPPSRPTAPPMPGRPREDPAAIAESLGRLLVFAAVYPAEHVRVTSLARPLAEAIARRASDETPCVLSVVEEGLVVDEED